LLSLRSRRYTAGGEGMEEGMVEGGIDYGLLAKPRENCSKDELDKMRKERNKMHAKRTRDRKKIFNKEMAKVIEVLDMENLKLRAMMKEKFPGDLYVRSEAARSLARPKTNARTPL
jgi:hypothetical protein